MLAYDIVGAAFSGLFAWAAANWIWILLYELLGVAAIVHIMRRMRPHALVEFIAITVVMGWLVWPIEWLAMWIATVDDEDETEEARR